VNYLANQTALKRVRFKKYYGALHEYSVKGKVESVKHLITN